MIFLGMPAPQHQGHMIKIGLLDGSGDRVVQGEQAGMIFLAWRCLYAEVTKGRIEGTTVSPLRAYKRTLAMIHTRWIAESARWVKWMASIDHTSRAQAFPMKHRERFLVSTGPCARFKISPKLLAEIERVRPLRA